MTYINNLQRLGVGDAFGNFGEIMGYVDECDIVAGYEVVDDGADAAFAGGVESVKWFVENKELWMFDKGACK